MASSSVSKLGEIKQVVLFNASPHDVYELIMDEKKHTKIAGSACKVSRVVGGSFSVFDGWTIGKNLELVSDKKIVQSWRVNDTAWPKGHDSIVKFVFRKSAKGTKLEFSHEKIPSGWKSDLAKGWNAYYWKPMKELLKKE